VCQAYAICTPPNMTVYMLITGHSLVSWPTTANLPCGVRTGVFIHIVLSLQGYGSGPINVIVSRAPTDKSAYCQYSQ